MFFWSGLCVCFFYVFCVEYFKRDVGIFWCFYRLGKCFLMGLNEVVVFVFGFYFENYL